MLHITRFTGGWQSGAAHGGASASDVVHLMGYLCFQEFREVVKTSVFSPGLQMFLTERQTNP